MGEAARDDDEHKLISLLKNKQNRNEDHWTYCSLVLMKTFNVGFMQCLKSLWRWISFVSVRNLPEFSSFMAPGYCGNRWQETGCSRILRHKWRNNCLLLVPEGVHRVWGAITTHTWCPSLTCWFIWLLWAVGTTVLPSFPESPASVSWILVQLHEKGRHIVLEETSLLGAVRASFKFNPFLEVFLSCRLPILFHVCILVCLWTACHALKQ